MSGAATRLVAAVARRRVPALAGWSLVLVALIAAAALAGTSSGTAMVRSPSTPEQAALDRLDERIPGTGDAAGWIVLTAPDGEGTMAARRLVPALRTAPGVTAVVDPVIGGTVSDDGRVVVIPVAVEPDPADPARAGTETRSAVETLVEQVRADGTPVDLGGAVAPVEPPIGPAGLIGVLAGFLLALVAARFAVGSITPAVAAVGSALVGSVAGAATVLLTGRVTVVQALAVLLLGAAIGVSGAIALVRRNRPAAVVGSGVVAVLAALSLVGTGSELAMAGLSMAVTITAAILASLTLLPALLGPTLRADDGARPRGRWSTWVVGHPAAALAGGALALAAVAGPAYLVGSGGPGAVRPADRADELLADAFGPGAAGPLLLVVEVGEPAALSTALPEVARAVRAVHGVAVAAPGHVASDGTLGVVTVLPTTGPADAGTRELVHRLEDGVAALGSEVGATVTLTGPTAVAIAVADEFAGSLPLSLLVLAVVVTAGVALTVRSVARTAAVVVGCALSVVVAVLLTRAVAVVTGWPAGWTGAVGPSAATPVVAITMLVAVTAGAAVLAPVARPRGRPVGGSALAAAALFGGAMAVPALAGIGLPVLIGVLVDAFIVRLTLIPAATAQLRRVPVRVDAGSVLPQPPPPGRAPMVDDRGTDGPLTGGAHAARGVHSAEPDPVGRRVIEDALAAPEPTRRTGRHRGAD